ncbi:major facilitator superfamily MFS_1 [Fibrisoma limi BUZ 3]|uniref:Major facilitator superfamily MFS_1 n=1 Tax=Fibrisoma limi BUZ 3 TaxID=1185876 RepID=I2GB39_9BACT|nr:major facilitator superfamily MFS_1 [Fibrisoma limi BUZ 3]
MRYGVFFYLYVMQGIPSGFALTALSNYLTAEGVKPEVIGKFAATVGLPWAFQFVWGPLIDRFQGSVMGRRKPWVLLSQFLAFLASLGILLINNPVGQITGLMAAFFIHSVFASIQDASVDALAISVIPEEERGRINAFMRAGFLIGIGVGAAVLSHIIRYDGFFYAALAQSAALLLFTIVTFFIRERVGDALVPWAVRRSSEQALAGSHPDHSFEWLFSELFRGLLARQSLLLFGAVIAGYLSISLFSRAFNFHLIRSLGWTDTSVSVLTGTYGMLLATVVALTGGFLADRFGARRLLVIVISIIAAYLIGFNLISDWWKTRDVARTGLVALYFMDPSLSIAAMPVLMAICRKGVEGSQFTTYMAFVNLSDIAGSFVSGHALNYLAAPTIGKIAGLLAFLAVLTAFFTLRHYRVASQG